MNKEDERCYFCKTEDVTWSHEFTDKNGVEWNLCRSCYEKGWEFNGVEKLKKEFPNHG